MKTIRAALQADRDVPEESKAASRQGSKDLARYFVSPGHEEIHAAFASALRLAAVIGLTPAMLERIEWEHRAPDEEPEKETTP